MNIKRSDLKSLIKEVIREGYDQAAHYALGYRRAQDNYQDNNVQKDFGGYKPEYKNGYIAGIKDARRNKWDNAIKNFLTNMGDMMKGKFGNRSDGL